MTKKIHIVSFDVPFPADYGGVIDVFYRLVALKECGYEITLHCYQYGRESRSELEEYCEEVVYYKRRRSVFSVLKKSPFIVATRNSKRLLENLLKDESPIIFEGLHTCYFLDNKALKGRIKIVRTHNIEQDYYAGLANSAQGWRKWFFAQESKKLKTFEAILSKASAVLAIQENDVKHFSQLNKNCSILTAAVPLVDSNFNAETKNYCLFHGNLSVLENEKAAIWVLNQITFPEVSPLIIAGKNPSNKLISLCKTRKVELIANPSELAMDKLILNAGVHIAYTEQSTGLKLKLIAALNSSGHVIVNPKMVEGTSLAEVCLVAESPKRFSELVQQCSSQALSADQFEKRQKVLSKQFNNSQICAILGEIIK